MLSGTTPSVEISPSVGFSPTMPHAAAGMRIEPPVSVPTDPKHMPFASAAAEPPLEPPADRVGSCGLPHRPERGLVAGRAERELVQVGLADDDGAGVAQAADDRRVVAGCRGGTRDPDVVGVPATSTEILDRDGNAVQRAA